MPYSLLQDYLICWHVKVIHLKLIGKISLLRTCFCMQERDQEPEWAERKNLAEILAGQLGKIYSKTEI